MFSQVFEICNFNSTYIQNLILIAIFSASFIFFKIYFKTNVTQEEMSQRKLLAESYLNKHKNSDCDFFFGAEGQEGSNVQAIS
jgi:hypothetical protein